MPDMLNLMNIMVDGRRAMQTIDGFGVNINSKYWDGGSLAPVLDLLAEDLGATLFRVDIFGKSDWIDPENVLDSSALNPYMYKQIYTNPVFRDGWALMKHLNSRGIKPYLTASGVVPRWMCAEDGRTLARYDEFCDMMVSLVDWARLREGIDFSLFGPLNETDLGPPEGPLVSPQEYVEVAALLDKKLTEAGLDDIRLVYAEQGRFNADFLSALARREELAGRIGRIGMHTYSDLGGESFDTLRAAVKGTAYDGVPVWMSEYGDLDQSGEREWYIAWVSTRRLLNCLAQGFSGAMQWDAYDNYHDHDEAWTIYGLIRNARRIYTPKKRYYAAKQVYRFVPPGFERVGLLASGGQLNALAFADRERRRFTVVGMNESAEGFHLNVKLDGFAKDAAAGPASCWRTTESENCVLAETVQLEPRNWPFDGFAVQLPPRSIFTLTNVK